jgi:hypothetical protein
MQSQELLNGLSSPVNAVHEEYKSFIRFANLCLYFSNGQQAKLIEILLEKNAKNARSARKSRESQNGL